MDPIAAINPKKDSTLAMLVAARAAGWSTWVIEQDKLFFRDNGVHAIAAHIEPSDDLNQWFRVLDSGEVPLSDFDAVLMRKDPPFNMNYVYATYLLEMAERAGTPVLNRPGSIRDANEKLFALNFPSCTPPLVVSSDAGVLTAFHEEHGDVIFKPLDGMGGASIFRVKEGDANRNVIIETLTEMGTQPIMVQRYLPEIVRGDTRILLINGEPVPYGLARIPSAGENRGNLAAGGEGVGRELTDRDRFICAEVGPVLREKGLYFVGIDVIGDYLTEVNVTCPTCIRELNAAYDLDIAGDYIRFIEAEVLG